MQTQQNQVVYVVSADGNTQGVTAQAHVPAPIIISNDKLPLTLNRTMYVCIATALVGVSLFWGGWYHHESRVYSLTQQMVGYGLLSGMDSDDNVLSNFGSSVSKPPPYRIPRYNEDDEEGDFGEANELEQAPRVRLLLGAEPEQEVIRAINDSDADRNSRLIEALKRHSDWIIAERDALGFSREASDQAKRLVEWLNQLDSSAHPRVEVRRFTKGFLHGKAFISEDSSLPAVLAGSSNFTYAGLSLNAELNLG